VRAVNLLPPDTRGASSKATGELAAGPEVKGGAGPFVVLGVLALCVAGTAAYVLTDNTIAQSKADLAAVNARKDAVTAQAAKLKPYADFESMARSRVQTVRDLAGRRFDWDQALRDLSRAIPADVTLATLNGDLGAGAGSSASPAGSSGLRSSIDAPAITLQGCTRDQRSVARLMARLRNVDGVTRVSISKSVKAVGASASTGEATAAAGPPCGNGIRPTFEVTMFFERAASAVAAAEGAAPTATTATATATPAATAAAGATATPTATATPATTGTTTASTTSQGGATP
jgi:Tfp pilus assembly protein PilN